MSNNDKEYEMCMRVENVVLPRNGYFGISAATGGLADDHDVLKLSVSSLRSPEMGMDTRTQDPDSKKFEDEFEEYQKKLKEQKDQWAKENPEEVSLKVVLFWKRPKLESKFLKILLCIFTFRPLKKPLI